MQIARAILACFIVVSLFALINSCASPSIIGEAEKVYHSYIPPAWAPPYERLSDVHFYYFPDYEIYYDVWDGHFWYFSAGYWLASADSLPSCCPSFDPNDAFLVLIHAGADIPWHHAAWYRDNYPAGCYDHYRNIVVQRHIIDNEMDAHEIIARAINENSDRVIFMSRPIKASIPPARTEIFGPIDPNRRTSYDRVMHEVPFKVIAPDMPSASKAFSYGMGYRKPTY